MLIGALLRVPAQAIHRRHHQGTQRGGLQELRLPHMAVLQFPGPDGARPSALAERAGVSKQAMNQLLAVSANTAMSNAPMRATKGVRDRST